MHFAPWNKGQCLHGALLRTVPECCKCFQQSRIARVARAGKHTSSFSHDVAQGGFGSNMLHSAKLHRLNWPSGPDQTNSSKAGLNRAGTVFYVVIPTRVCRPTINSKINGTPKGVCLLIPKLHSILAVANLLAHNNLWLCYYICAIKFTTAKIECGFEMGK